MSHFPYLKKTFVFVVLFYGNVLAFAGSHEDYFKAVLFDDARGVHALLSRGFDPNTVNLTGESGLMIAVREPSPKVAQLLVSWPKVKTEVRNDKDESVLMLAALRGYLPLVKQLLEHGASVNKTGWTALHYAATTGQVKVIDVLLEHCAHINAQSPNGSTPLMMAALYGSPETVKLLIQAGANLHLENQLGMTALAFAVRGQRENAQELIETALQRRTIKPTQRQACLES